MNRVSMVVIGRNEGDRLQACLAAVPEGVGALVYVDSGSTDHSLDIARAANAPVVALDPARPFSAARARNEGVAALGVMERGAEYVQFVDGDCTLAPGWVVSAAAFLDAHPQAAAVCGRLRERHPEVSVYNRLCDREWDRPAGRIPACGGIAMMRRAAFIEAGGFRDDLIAGEEPELCVRLRRAGWEVWRIDAEMAVHDAAMTRFSQWWKRARRAGFAAAEGMALHGAAPERHGVVETRRALLWGLLLPVGAVLGSLVSPWSAILLVAYPAQVVRLAVREGGRRGDWEQAAFLTLGKFPEAIGVVNWAATRWRNGRQTLIEYK